MTNQYRIVNIQKVTLNNRKVKLFDAYCFDEKLSAYVFLRKIAAPARCANKDLLNYI